MPKILKATRKPFPVQVVIVTERNLLDVARWCKGTVVESPDGNHIKVPVKKPIVPKQTQAFAGDYVLKSGNGFKVYTKQSFDASFDLVPEKPRPKPARVKPEVFPGEPAEMQEQLTVPDNLVETAEITEGGEAFLDGGTITHVAAAQEQATVAGLSPEAIADLVVRYPSSTERLEHLLTEATRAEKDTVTFEQIGTGAKVTVPVEEVRDHLAVEATRAKIQQDAFNLNKVTTGTVVESEFLGKVPTPSQVFVNQTQLPSADLDVVAERTRRAEELNRQRGGGQI